MPLHIWGTLIWTFLQYREIQVVDIPNVRKDKTFFPNLVMLSTLDILFHFFSFRKDRRDGRGQAPPLQQPGIEPGQIPKIKTVYDHWAKLNTTIRNLIEFLFDS